jgi:hypothetical protein
LLVENKKPKNSPRKASGVPTPFPRGVRVGGTGCCPAIRKASGLKA